MVVADWGSDGLWVEGGRVDGSGRGRGLKRAVVDGLARVLHHGVRRGMYKIIKRKFVRE